MLLPVRVWVSLMPAAFFGVLACVVVDDDSECGELRLVLEIACWF